MHAEDILFYGHRSLMRSMRGLADEHWSQSGVCGIWSAKDVIAHLASYELMLSEVLGSFQGLQETPTLDRYQAGDNANDAEVEARNRLSHLEALQEYEAAHELVAERIKAIPVASLREKGAIAWYGEQYDLEDYIVYVGYGHKREHAAQFNSFKDSLKS